MKNLHWIWACLLILGCSTVPAIENRPDYLDPSDLLDALGDEQSFIRELAARELGASRNPEAVSALIHRLEAPEEHHFVKAAVAEALGLIRKPEAVPALEALYLSSPNREVRYQCIRALAGLAASEPSAIGAIEEALHDECLLVRSLSEAELLSIRGESP
jgi:HEAT repeat protein